MNSIYNTDAKKRRIVGLILLAILLALFLWFNRVPKLDTVRADLAVATSPVAECFQGFCIESSPESSLLSRWWDFSMTYLDLVTVGMTFAFLVAGLTEAFLFPRTSDWNLTSTGIKGSLKGLLVGPAMTLCSACIVPVASAFRRRGSGVETILAITQGSSTLNLPAVIMATLVFVPLIGGTRIGLSLIGALLIGPLVAKLVRNEDDALDMPQVDTNSLFPDQAGWGEALGGAFIDWAKITAGHVVRLAPVMILAGFASGLAIQWISPDAVNRWLGDDVLGIAIAATLGIAINVPLLFEIPLVAVLLLAGMGTAPAATLLFTAAAGGPITFWGLTKVMPNRAVAAYGASTWGLGAIGGLVVLLFVSFGGDVDFGIRAEYRNADQSNIAASAQSARAASASSGLEPVSSAGARATAMRFTDVTIQAGVTDLHMVQDVIPDKPEPSDMFGGAVAEDFDGDGWVDLFVLGGESPIALYMNQGDGTFAEESATRGAVLPPHLGAAAGAADFDNDGDIDIVVTSQNAPHFLLINGGGGRFAVDSTTLTEPESFATSPSWGDADNDGLLELVIGEWNSERTKAYDAYSNPSSDLNALYGTSGNPNEPRLGPDSVMGSDGMTPLFMYRNKGQGRLELSEFRKIRAVDLWVFAPRFADLDGDGLTDLAVVADFGMSRTYRNVGGGMFELVPGASDTFTDENGMGAALGDYDNDGDLDWFVSSIFGQTSPEKAGHGGTGNRLYRNDANMEFADVTEDAGVREGGWGWGASFGDLDNDGDLDLYHVNGWIQDERDGDPAEFNDQPAVLFDNRGDGVFDEVASTAGAAHRGQGRGVILFDYDNDGDLDIFITNNSDYVFDGSVFIRNPGEPVLLRNDTSTGNHWLKVTLEGAAPLHRDGIGSRVYVTVGGVIQMRELHASTNYLAQEPGTIAHFGVGDATTIDEVRVEWVNGHVEIRNNVPADQHIAISSP
ncbi:MAG TPA: FG-GAP-like repeat-containing protein [SAR202 cluster bacterium]|nr:FG-GAP-like repeat-containing protein [SAR202 cluster bacterium]MDP7224402.1 FG-GAP-like repeat-containing protein [SAR202 cluster bacterium]MDP7413178.1 FG-GAP-like repeat-containing protein [SAR202 cluster bacterium]HJO83104.1 FG-GAP-like repeat-containing protein [SAR202 cluster bacterium]